MVQKTQCHPFGVRESLSPKTKCEYVLDLLRQILEFSARVFAAHNKRLAEEQVSQALKIVFEEKGENMRPTIFDEKFDEGVAVVRPDALPRTRNEMTTQTESNEDKKKEVDKGGNEALPFFWLFALSPFAMLLLGIGFSANGLFLMLCTSASAGIIAPCVLIYFSWQRHFFCNERRHSTVVT